MKNFYNAFVFVIGNLFVALYALYVFILIAFLGLPIKIMQFMIGDHNFSLNSAIAFMKMVCAPVLQLHIFSKEEINDCLYDVFGTDIF